MKTSKLQGAALDWAVAKCSGHMEQYDFEDGKIWLNAEAMDLYSPSTCWSQGGPIIEQEDISFRKYHNPDSPAHGKYYAQVCQSASAVIHWKDWGTKVLPGPTSLIAAMRCYVASKLGDEVEIPKELNG